ncbi:hypothetical protein [Streptomyces nigrescens]|uniref:hypothetical protein n=1 Tax=Streptomyces nigrescens TaxID=1920 RepID=UPI0021C46413|nr:hypothetical protein [Streptomyces nigrescens]
MPRLQWPSIVNCAANTVRRAIIAAMNRLFADTPQRSNGRLNVTQLAIEAGLKPWHLTYQHPGLKDLFQEQAAKNEAKRPAHPSPLTPSRSARRSTTTSRHSEHPVSADQIYRALVALGAEPLFDPEGV